MDNVVLMEVLHALKDRGKSIKYLLLRILDECVVSEAMLEEGGEGFRALGEDGAVLVQDGAEQIGVGEVGQGGHLGGQLLESVGLPGALVQEQDVVGLVAHQAERVEVVQVHQLAVAHHLISLYTPCYKLNKR